jgi:cell division cycle 2-like protein
VPRKHYNTCISGESLSLVLTSLTPVYLKSESPLPKHPDLFGSFPSAAAGEKYVSYLIFSTESFKHINRKRRPFDSPSAPVRAADYKLLTEFDLP